MWICLLCKNRATTNIIKHSRTENHKAVIREVERRKHVLAEYSSCQEVRLMKNFQKETDDTDCEYQRGDLFKYSTDSEDSELESISASSENLNHLISDISSESQDTLSDISEDMESVEDTIFETDFSTGSLGEDKD
ncbi:hypothetical protein BY996DRAFT_6502486 [Phakopsora pachyrhizi]|uniref:U1-type domain-containing protein n=1 Tax=Phakopsora pachyrhizi TaxID=170000 RepID=A0AAV0AR10_PHAPC|nr:hypothetical protein BY996DRAFT_6502486 [Phakopsora pachyrhizi]CAH7670948.1 hypothetical protein PPACK8108_LOCUS5699 [Phakopsora pachyrhizi]